MHDDARHPLLHNEPRSSTPPSAAGSVASVSTNGPSRRHRSGSSNSLHTPSSHGHGSRHDDIHLSGASPLAGSHHHGGGSFGGGSSFGGGQHAGGNLGGGGQNSGLGAASGSGRHRVEPSAMSVRKSVAEVRHEGLVYRESTYLDGVVNQRYGAIYPHALVTFR